MSDAVSALLNVPCAEHRPTGTPDECAVCGTPVAVYAELKRLRAIERRAQLITRNRLRDSAERHVAHEILGEA